MAGKCDGTVSATYANCTSAIDSYLCQAKAYSDAVMATISSMCVFSGSFSISNALLYAALSKMFANLHEKCGKTRKSTALHRTFLSWLWRRDIGVTTWSRRVPPKRVRVTGFRRRQCFTLISVKGIDVGSRQNLNEAAKIIFPNTYQIIREYLLTRQAELQITK